MVRVPVWSIILEIIPESSLDRVKIKVRDRTWFVCLYALYRHTNHALSLTFIFTLSMLDFFTDLNVRVPEILVLPPSEYRTASERPTKS